MEYATGLPTILLKRVVVCVCVCVCVCKCVCKCVCVWEENCEGKRKEKGGGS